MCIFSDFVRGAATISAHSNAITSFYCIGVRWCCCRPHYAVFVSILKFKPLKKMHFYGCPSNIFPPFIRLFGIRICATIRVPNILFSVNIRLVLSDHTVFYRMRITGTQLLQPNSEPHSIGDVRVPFPIDLDSWSYAKAVVMGSSAYFVSSDSPLIVLIRRQSGIRI